MSTKDPAFLFYPKDWLEGTAELHPCEKGVFIDLLSHHHQKGGLPTDVNRLARIAGLSIDDFLKIWEVLKEKFFELNGKFYNKKMLSVITERSERSIKNKIIGTFASVLRLRTEPPEIKSEIKKAFKIDDFLTISTERSTERLTERLTEWYILRLKSIEDANTNIYSKGKEGMGEKPLEEPIVPAMVNEFKKSFPKYPTEEIKDFEACFSIAKKIGEEKNFNSVQILSEGREHVLKRWGEIILFIKTDKWYSTRSLSDISKEWQRLIQTINSNVKGTHNNNAKPTFTDKVTENNRYFEQFGENGITGEG